MQEAIEIAVFGKPQPAGSKRSMPIYKCGKPLVKNGRVIINTIDANPKSSGWKQEVAAAAAKVCQGEPLQGAIRFTVACFMERPKSHYRTGKNAHLLKDSAPEFYEHTKKPDVLKLARGIEDALTGIAWGDDAQIVQESLLKCYGAPMGVYIRIEPYRPTKEEMAFGDEVFRRLAKIQVIEEESHAA